MSYLDITRIVEPSVFDFVYFSNFYSILFFFLCVKTDCGPLRSPASGSVTTPGGTSFGKTATYSCRTGYHLSGTKTRTCGASGTWSLIAPTCKIMGMYFITALFLRPQTGCACVLNVDVSNITAAFVLAQTVHFSCGEYFKKFLYIIAFEN